MAVNLQEKLKKVCFSPDSCVRQAVIDVGGTFIARSSRELAEGQIPAGADIIVSKFHGLDEKSSYFLIRYYPNESCEITTHTDDETAIDYEQAYIEARREALANISSRDLMQEAYRRQDDRKAQAKEEAATASTCAETEGGIPVPDEIARQLDGLNFAIRSDKVIDTGNGSIRIVTTISSYADKKAEAEGG